MCTDAFEHSMSPGEAVQRSNLELHIVQRTQQGPDNKLIDINTIRVNASGGKFENTGFPS